MIRAIKDRIESMIRTMAEPFIVQSRLEAKAAPYTKILQRQLFNYYQQEVRSGKRWNICD